MDSVKNVMSDSGNVSFNWVHREANQLVHVLAKWSLSPSFFLVILIWDLTLQILLMLSWLSHPRLL